MQKLQLLKNLMLQTHNHLVMFFYLCIRRVCSFNKCDFLLNLLKGDGILDDIEPELNKLALHYENNTQIAIRKLSMLSTNKSTRQFVDKYNSFSSPFFILLK